MEKERWGRREKEREEGGRRCAQAIEPWLFIS
jgi:hypothetical protein